jgi:glutathione S-transferase
MLRGLQAYQSLLPEDTGFSFDETPTLADVCLIPQLYNAHRWGTDFSSLKRLTEIETRCLALPAFAAAQPHNQPDTT